MAFRFRLRFSDLNEQREPSISTVDASFDSFDIHAPSPF
jgi:hypothetical protein